MKQYISTEQTVKAIKAGARLMLIKIDLNNAMAKHISLSETLHEDNLKSFISIQQGDEIYIAEEFVLGLTWVFDGEIIYIEHSTNKDKVFYINDTTDEDFGDEEISEFKILPASEMTEQQSRFKFKVGEVSIKRVQDITHDEINLISCIKKPNVMSDGRSFYSDYLFMESLFDDWLKDQDIDYNDSQYVALVELKDKECIHCSQ